MQIKKQYNTYLISIVSISILLFQCVGFAKHRSNETICHRFFSGSKKTDIATIEDSHPLLQNLLTYKKILNLTEIKDRKNDLTELSTKFDRLSAEDKIKILGLIKNNYIEVKIHKNVKNHPLKALKRQFDFILSIDAKAYEYFKSELGKNHENWEAIIQSYLNNQAQAAGLAKSVDLNNLLYIAYRLQDVIKSNPDFLDSKVYLYGSLINGRSLSGLSDLDYAISDPKLLAAVESLALKFDELDSMSISYSEGHMSSPHQAHSYGFLNPLVFVVHHNYIELRAYKKAPYQNFLKNPDFFSFSFNLLNHLSFIYLVLTLSKFHVKSQRLVAKWLILRIFWV